MKIGILSDTHGSLTRTQSAISLLKAAEIQTIFHCGDIGSEDVLIELITQFQDSQIPIYAVLGNVDYPDDEYQHLCQPGQLEILGRFGEITLAEIRIAIVHGDNSQNLQKAISFGEYEYVFTGHTHKKEDSRHGSTRVINPGAVYRATQPSVAVLDLSQDQLEFLEIV